MSALPPDFATSAADIRTEYRVTLDREHTLRGKKELDWFFANRRWVRTKEKLVVEAAYATRPHTDSSRPLLFLILVTKRSFKRAHDRNKRKRWLREAVVHTPSFTVIEQDLRERESQLLVMLRVSAADVAWNEIRTSVERIGDSLSKTVRKKGTAEKKEAIPSNEEE